MFILDKIFGVETKARHRLFYSQTVVLLKDMFNYSDVEAEEHAKLICHIFKKNIQKNKLNRNLNFTDFKNTVKLSLLVQ